MSRLQGIRTCTSSYQLSSLFLLKCLCSLLFSLSATNGLSVELKAKLCPDVQKAVETNSFPIDVIVDFKDNNKWHKTTRLLMEESNDSSSNRGEKLDKLVKSLTKATKDSQHRVTSILQKFDEKSVENTFASTVSKNMSHFKQHFKSYHNFFIVNSMSINQAQKEIILKIAEDDSVKEIKLDVFLENTDPETEVQTSNIEEYQFGSFDSKKKTSQFWGVDRVGVRELWKRGYKGKGIVVGSIDSGVMANHILLKSNHRKSHGWYDPRGVSKYLPVDKTGHGTHTVGTMVGSKNFGIAPEAEWIACRVSGFDEKPKTSYILKCMEFMTCPWDIFTLEKDCSKAPHVINNSWGSSRLVSKKKMTRYDEAINLWRKNDIIPVFAAGNTRHNMSCGSLSYPAELPSVIAVGATDEHNKLTYFSSTGPTISGLTKPDISAPGRKIWSASIRGPKMVSTKSGTSMAAPHITGVIALWLSRDPHLTFEKIYKLLTVKANRNVVSLNESCGTNQQTKAKFVFPNNMYGYGLINATAALDVPIQKDKLPESTKQKSPELQIRKNMTRAASARCGSSIPLIFLTLATLAFLNL